MEDISEIQRPELVIGLVGSIGTDLQLVEQKLQQAFFEWGYQSKSISMIELLCKSKMKNWMDLPHEPEDERYHKHMDAGDDFCRTMQRPDALAAMSIGAIREIRNSKTNNADQPIYGNAYFLRSIKRLQEVKTLRQVYGRGFLLVAAYAPKDKRSSNLARKIASSHGSTRANEFLDKAQTLIYRDEKENDDHIYGQDVRSAFPLADVFINTANQAELQHSIDRFIEILFGYPFHTPTVDEYNMFLAAGASLRSSSESRQVGAAISTQDGETIAVGSNEVPKAGGGQYWPTDHLDHRDFNLPFDTSDSMKKSTLQEIITILLKKGWFDKEKGKMNIEDLITEAEILLQDSQLMNVVEFGRAVHAEMAALLDAARRGVVVKGSILYSTTFPCHECTRHVIASGISRVVYIEPYPKSLAMDLHEDSISVDNPGESNGKVSFEPFVGIAPRCYMRMFKRPKQKDWRNKKEEKHLAFPRFAGSPATYIRNEKDMLNILHTKMKELGLLSA